MLESDRPYGLREMVYLIFGQLPVMKPDGRQVLVPERVELQYSLELHLGMSMSELIRLMPQ